MEGACSLSSRSGALPSPRSICLRAGFTLVLLSPKAPGVARALGAPNTKGPGCPVQSGLCRDPHSIVLLILPEPQFPYRYPGPTGPPALQAVKTE